MARPDFEAAFRDGATLHPRDRAPFRIAVHRAGRLEIRSGRVTCCDPLSAYELEPLARAVPVGSHEVLLAVADLGADQRVAAAMVRFAPGTPVRWEMATRAGEDLASLGPGQIFGYGVDAGTGCFADGAAAAELEDEEVQQALQDALQATYRPTWSAAAVALGDRGNVVGFSSGWGDGFYSSYWGLAADGAPMVLATDFGLLTEPVDREQVIDLSTVGPVACPELEALGVRITRVPTPPGRERCGPISIEVHGTRSVELDPVGPDGARVLVDLAIGSDVWSFGTGREFRVRVRVLEDLVPIRVT